MEEYQFYVTVVSIVVSASVGFVAYLLKESLRSLKKQLSCLTYQVNQQAKKVTMLTTVMEHKIVSDIEQLKKDVANIQNHQA